MPRIFTHLAVLALAAIVGGCTAESALYGRGGSGGSDGAGGSGATVASSTTTTTSVGGGPGAGGSGPSVFVNCDVTPCDVSGPGICCLPLNGQGTANCFMAGNCPSTHSDAECDGASDCPASEVCCGITSSLTILRCQSSCAGSNFIICQSDAECSFNQTCVQAVALPPGYKICF